MGFKVIEVQPTPNPNAAKFVLNGEITDRPVSFLSPAEGAGHPLASQLFGIKGVASVLLLGDFVTINKQADAEWKQITDKAKEILQKTP
jgi:NFU1 iron-sulfur cluster scaffold homolog, mitochondrial